MKRKFKKWLLNILISNLPWILVVLIIVSGLSAVVSFVTNLFKWGEGQNIDINNCTIEQMIDAVNDKSIFTNKVLKDMMIDRKSLLTLLNTVEEYNNRDESKIIQVEFNYSYTKEEPKIVAGKVVGMQSVTYNGTQYRNVSVNNNDFIDDYDIDWQTIYIFALFRSIGNYKNWTYTNVVRDSSGKIVDKEPIMLNEDDVLEIIESLKPKFKYKFDVVKSSKTSYSLSEAQAVPNTALSFSNVVNGVSYSYSGYVPVSVLNRVEAPSYTDVYFMNGTRVTSITTYSAEKRFIKIGKVYYEYFQLKLYYDLLKNLPGGENVANTSRYLLNQNKSFDDYEIDNALSIGGKIAAFALLFEGKIPYVWGGTSLENGVDCSGFSQSVHKNFNINIPRTSREQARGGVPVSLDELQPGDLVFYTDSQGTINHVAISIGNKKVISAGSVKVGIRVTRYNYRKPVKAVRYY